jgi:hypothetical protein
MATLAVVGITAAVVVEAVVVIVVGCEGEHGCAPKIGGDCGEVHSSADKGVGGTKSTAAFPRFCTDPPDGMVTIFGKVTSFGVVLMFTEAAMTVSK